MKRPSQRASPNEGHWLLRREEGRRRLDARAIIEQAHALVHEGGTAALTMRPLAAALGTSTSALYRYLPSKEWLLIAIVDHVYEEVDTSSALRATLPARDRLERLSSSWRGVLAAHPHLHEILTSRVVVTPNTSRIAEAALTCLRDLGIGDGELVDSYNAWCGYVVGFTAIETKPPEHAPDPKLRQAMRQQLKRATAGSESALGRMMWDVAGRAYGLRWRPGRLGHGQASFEWGLTALLDGLEGGLRMGGRRSSRR